MLLERIHEPGSPASIDKTNTGTGHQTILRLPVKQPAAAWRSGPGCRAIQRRKIGPA
jgi:hypothetical protein